MQLKIKILLAVFFVMFGGLIARLSYWQIIMASELSQKAKGQYNSSKITEAPRGNILASDGSYWVLRDTVWQMVANPKKISESPNKIATKIAEVLVNNKDDAASVLAEEQKIISLLSKQNLSWVVLEKNIDDDRKKLLQELNIDGITFVENESRFYPEASSSAHLIGFVGKDKDGANIGYFGLEGYYNLPLSGKPGYIGQEKDALGSPILIGELKEVVAIGGVDLVTGIDKRIQLLVENKLAEGIKKFGATSGSVTVMDPNTGVIMAMASQPSFDPRNYWEFNDSLFRNPVISNTFEPGSIFKPIIMASGLDGGYIEPDTKCDICNGPLNVDGYQIKTWNNKYHPDATMTEVIVNSDNVGMSFVARKMGVNTLQDYLEKFGIGSPTGIDLQGEASLPLRKRGTWSNVDLDTASFGQGVAVTPIQIIRAISAIANGGYLPSPHVVTEIRGDGWKKKIEQPRMKRIISEKAAKEASMMMVNAANLGESRWAKIPGFDNIAVKTGTAQIPVSGHYDEKNTNHSFIGFAPVGNPKFIMLVILQSPSTSPWASETAAPVWYSIAKDLFPYLGVQPGGN